MVFGYEWVVDYDIVGFVVIEYDGVLGECD